MADIEIDASAARTAGYFSAADVIDPGAMDTDQLRAEVWLWRTYAARELASALRVIQADARRGIDRPAEVAEASEWATVLAGALSGDDLDKCSLCAGVLVPGQAALREVDSGDVHAHCLGERIETEGEPKPGDRYQLDPEGVVDGDDEPIPDSDGVLTSYAAPAPFEAEAVAALIAQARALTNRPAEA